MFHINLASQWFSDNSLAFMNTNWSQVFVLLFDGKSGWWSFICLMLDCFDYGNEQCLKCIVQGMLHRVATLDVPPCSSDTRCTTSDTGRYGWCPGRNIVYVPIAWAVPISHGGGRGGNWMQCCPRGWSDNAGGVEGAGCWNMSKRWLKNAVKDCNTILEDSITIHIVVLPELKMWNDCAPITLSVLCWIPIIWLDCARCLQNGPVVWHGEK